MNISIFDLFKIGIGPSSSHTVGPMKAAKKFLMEISETNLDNIDHIIVELYGSLALTGKGHGTDTAILLGLSGFEPDTIETEKINSIIETIKKTKIISLIGKKNVPYIKEKTISFFKRKILPEHPNGMVLRAYDIKNNLMAENTFFSVGGGFIITKQELESSKDENKIEVLFPFKTMKELVKHTESHSIKEIILHNEKSFLSDKQITENIVNIWQAMQQCVKHGCATEGILPGGLEVKRRAPELYKKLTAQNSNDPLAIFDWVSLFALAVNEENASGGRVVTAPTNGASGIIPAILYYYEKYYEKLDIDKLLTFFTVSGAIGLLYKENASISGAEMGCQGEVGVACSMAAGGLTALLEGTANQIECAAEIGMEHNLGLTCDPIKGLVQIPCIERNTMGAIKAINASRLALNGDGKQKVSLDRVIRTMKQTGRDMKLKYKETSKGGLAKEWLTTNVIEC